MASLKSLAYGGYDYGRPASPFSPGSAFGSSADLGGTANPYTGPFGSSADTGGSVRNQPGFGYGVAPPATNSVMNQPGFGYGTAGGSNSIYNGMSGGTYGTSPGVTPGTSTGTGYGGAPASNATVANPTSWNGTPTYGAGATGWRSMWNGDVGAVQGSAGAQNVAMMAKMSHGYDPTTGQWHANQPQNGTPMAANFDPTKHLPAGMSLTPEQQAMFDSVNADQTAGANQSALYSKAFGYIPGSGETGYKQATNDWINKWLAANPNNEQGYNALNAQAANDPIAAMQRDALNRYFATMPDPGYTAFQNSGQPGTYAGANFAPPAWWYGASGAQPSVVGTPGAIPQPVAGMGRNTNGK